MVDTHIYDGKLDNKSIPELKDIIFLSNEEKKIKCMDVYNGYIKKERNKISIHFLMKIIDDIGTEQNYDPTNSLRAEDLLVLCSNFRSNDDFLNELEIQLIDMQSGFCSQGRTHRLFQLVKCYLE
jgi:hypothetical protein